MSSRGKRPALCAACAQGQCDKHDLRALELMLAHPEIIQTSLKNKYFDSVSAPTAMGCGPATAVGVTPFAPISTASSAVLNQVPRGNSSITRVGRSIRCLSLRVRGDISSNLAGTTGGPLTYWVVLDSSPNQTSTMPSWTSIFTAQDFRALESLTGQGRFTILHREDVKPVQSLTNVGTIATLFRVFDHVLLFKDLRTAWTDASTTGLLPTMMTNAIYIYASAIAWNGGNVPVFTLSTRLEFEDI